MPTSRQFIPTAKNSGSLPQFAGFAVAVLFFVLSGYNAYRNTVSLRQNTEAVETANNVIASLENVVSLMKDAETGQRGFLITGNESYLEPYRTAKTSIEGVMTRMRELTKDSPTQREVVPQVEAAARAKFDELKETIDLRREKGFDAALAVVVTNKGKDAMDLLRKGIDTMEAEERALKKQRTEDMEVSHRVAVVSGLATAILGIVLTSAVMLLVRRARMQALWEAWAQNGRLELATALAGEKSLEPLSEGILTFLSRYVDAHAGAIFAARKGHFHRVGMIGVPKAGDVPSQFKAGEGLLGQAVAEKAPRRIDDIPDGYLKVGSALGEGRPRQLLILPATADNQVNAVIELGFLKPLDPRKQEFLMQLSDPVGVAVKAALYRENLQDLLAETQQQAEELQAQSEELRVSNEELEEQSRALRESQARLEQQQAELEQINTQLSEQAQVLERQRNDLQTAKVNLEAQAREVEQASRYKSDFLANMSHELRTPLNSSLILAKLLADNRPGNLTPEQVKYAQTIESAGSDLLVLINDVLDLSKIEAGHMEIHAEEIDTAKIISGLHGIFDPIASQKGVSFRTEILPGTPSKLFSDSQRLEQVLKNLLSNALKFTSEGEVTLRVRLAASGQVAFVVTDTGIGITPEQQQIIFDPFFQADGTTSRKYGGTGLGLSISRNLARLLGGEIQLASEFGKGSVFTLVMPQNYEGSATVSTAPVPVAVAPVKPTSAMLEPLPVATGTAEEMEVPDDRGSLSGSKRLILTVEDDEAFARIVYDLAHEMGFQCLIATTAQSALALAQKHLPSAIVLDVGLPDNSGLLVLERLKADVHTRHIPVHVVSGSDYTKTAMSLGAVGYMLKPVKREELAAAFEKLETRLTQTMRQVLVVEDDPAQIEAMKGLLGSQDVEAVCARTAAECLEHLRTTTFDCMVLDLSLPDASGFALLEKLSAEDSYSFPPVIVYTGRELSNEEEQRLRKYSKSIIIKGAKSHERLLDEVTLFLHQVVSDLPPEKQRMLEAGGNRDAALEGRHVLIAEDDVRNVFALTSLLESRGVKLTIARNGREALKVLETSLDDPTKAVDLVLMDIMMPEMDGLTAMREIRKRREWRKLPVIALTAKAMKSDQEQCLAAGANDYLAKPLDVEKLLSLIRVWMPR